MPGIEAWLTLAVLALMFIALVRELWAPDVVVFAALVMLWGTGVVDTREALAGFSNPQVLAVAFLFIVSAALQETGALARVSRVLLRPDANGNVGLTRMLGPVVGLSAFLNNTPIVGIFAPTIRDWAVRTGRSPSRYLLPLSYAAILGGTCTLIGTSTNLVVSGLLEESGHAGFGMFGLSLVALPVAAVGFGFLVTVGHRLLPERRSPDEDLRRMREFGVVLQVSPTCSMVGQSVEAAGLRSLSGLFLAEIERGTRRIVPVRPTDVVQAGDRLGFYGLAETVVELRRTPGLEPVVAEDDDATEGGTVTAQRPGTARGVFEVVVSAQSPLVGSTLKAAGFRRRYDAAVLAIHRNGERLRSKLGEVELLAGDVLMIEASPGFRKAWGHSDEFYLVAEVDAAAGTAAGWRAPVSLLVVAVMILVMSVTTVPTVQAAAVAVVLLLVLGAVRPQSARRSLDMGYERAGGGGELVRDQPSRRQQWVGADRSDVRPGPGRRRRSGGSDRRRLDFDGDLHRSAEQQRGGGPDVPHRAGDGPTVCCGKRGATRPDTLGGNGRPGRIDELHHPHRLPDQPDGVRPRRIPVRRLFPNRGSDGGVVLRYGHGMHPAGLGSVRRQQRMRCVDDRSVRPASQTCPPLECGH